MPVLLELLCPDSCGLVPWMHVLALADLVAETISLVVLTLADLTSSAFMFPLAVLDRALLQPLRVLCILSGRLALTTLMPQLVPW